MAKVSADPNCPLCLGSGAQCEACMNRRLTPTLDLSRCSWCGRRDTLTSTSAGNRCVAADDCDQARAEALRRVEAMR